MAVLSVSLHAPLRAGRISEFALNELPQQVSQDGAPGTPSASELSVDRETSAHLQSVLENLVERTQEIDSAHQKLEEDLPSFAVQLAVGIAREILRTEIDAGRYSVEAIVRKALAVASTGRSSCTIHLHPEDMKACDPSRFRSNTNFEADPDIARGDVHVATPQGMLVHDIDAALTRVREELFEATR